MQSKATTVSAYLKELPPERRTDIAAVRKVILDNLPAGYEEIMQYGMIGYVVPLTVYPQGYLDNPKAPLPYVCLASQKNHISLYLMNIYGNKKNEQWFHDAYKKSGKKLDMGKSCVRFKHAHDVPLDVIAQAIALTPVKQLIEYYETAHRKKRHKE